MAFQDDDAAMRIQSALAEKEKEQPTATVVEEKETETEKKELPVAEKEQKEEAPKVEAKEEKKETKEDKKEEKEVPATNGAAKEWYEDEKEETPKATTESEQKESQEQAIAEWQKKAKEYEELQSDTEFQAFLAAKKTGKNLIEFVNEIKGEDVSKLTPEELFKRDLVKQKYTEDEIETELAEFNSKLKSEKERIVKPIRQEMMEEQKEQLKKFSGKTIEEMKKREEIAQKQEAHRLQAIQHTEKYKKDIVGKEMFGIKVTKEMAETAYDEIMHKSAVPIKEDGSIDVETYFNNILALRNLKQIVKANIDRATNNGRREVLDEVSRVSKTIKTGALPDKASETEKDMADAVAKSKSMNPVYG